MFVQKLDYIHFNRVAEKWNLAENYLAYLYSSVGVYEAGKMKSSFLMDYSELM